MVSLSFGMFQWAATFDSQLLWYLGISCLGLSAMLALIACQRCWRYTIAVFAILLATYTAVYVALSANGRYEPAAWGLDGVKWYAWAPAGFVRDYAWDVRMMIAFAPLYYLDQEFWHTERESESGRYPINRVPDLDVSDRPSFQRRIGTHAAASGVLKWMGHGPRGSQGHVSDANF